VLAAQSSGKRMPEANTSRHARAICALNSTKRPRGSEFRPPSSSASSLASFSMDEVRRSPAVTIRRQSDAYGEVTLDLIRNRFCLSSQMNVFMISYLVFRSIDVSCLPVPSVCVAPLPERLPSRWEERKPCPSSHIADLPFDS